MIRSPISKARAWKALLSITACVSILPLFSAVFLFSGFIYFKTAESVKYAWMIAYFYHVVSTFIDTIYFIDSTLAFNKAISKEEEEGDGTSDNEVKWQEAVALRYIVLFSAISKGCLLFWPHYVSLLLCIVSHAYTFMVFPVLYFNQPSERHQNYVILLIIIVGWMFCVAFSLAIGKYDNLMMKCGFYYYGSLVHSGITITYADYVMKHLLSPSSSPSSITTTPPSFSSDSTKTL